MKKFYVILGSIIIGLGYLINLWKASIIVEMDQFEIDFSQIPGKNIVITGGNSGLGFETALSLAKARGNIILACRSMSRCETAKQVILTEAPDGKITCMELYLSFFESVREFTQRYLRRFENIDILINNAGLSLHDRIISRDGYEMQMASNHLGHFYLTSLLFPYFNKHGRIVNVSSLMHYLVFSSAAGFLNSLMSESDYDLAITYSKTKLANLLFTNELNRRLWKSPSKNPKDIVAIAVHPGFTATNLQNSKFPFWEEANNYVAMKLKHGALAQISGNPLDPFAFLFVLFPNYFFSFSKAASDSRVNATYHNYYGPEFFSFGKPVVSMTSSLAADEDLQETFWEKSKELTFTSFHGL
jgi:NAD(P)-dependent dehydrogenase (short-subunit alcohol dehydrogenase family)